MEDPGIDLLSDFGFKFVFGREETKANLLHFLNALLPPEDQIVDFTFVGTEQVGEYPVDKTIIYDLLCRTADERQLQIEVQRRLHQKFTDRVLYYLGRLMTNAMREGKPLYEVRKTYMVLLLDFVLDPDTEDYIKRVELKDQHGVLFTDKLRLYFIQLPKFRKELSELETPIDQYLYAFRHMKTLDHLPRELSEDQLQRIFDGSRRRILTSEQRDLHDRLVKSSIDYRTELVSAHFEGRVEGKAEGRVEGKDEVFLVATKRGLANSQTLAEIADFLDTTEEYLLMLLERDRQRGEGK